MWLDEPQSDNEREGFIFLFYLVLFAYYWNSSQILALCFLLFRVVCRCIFVLLCILSIICCCCYVMSVMSDSVLPHRRQPTRLLCPWDFPGKSTGVGCHCLRGILKEAVPGIASQILFWLESFGHASSLSFFNLSVVVSCFPCYIFIVLLKT